MPRSLLTHLLKRLANFGDCGARLPNLQIIAPIPSIEAGPCAAVPDAPSTALVSAVTAIVRCEIQKALEPGGMLASIPPDTPPVTSSTPPSTFELGDLRSQGQPSVVVYGSRGAD